MPAEKRSHVLQHKNSATHLSNADRKNASKQKQSFLSLKLGTEPKDVFHLRLCEALAAANIPVATLHNPVLKSFLEEFCNKKVPDESTLRKNYLPQLYEKAIEEIRADIADHFIWLSVDETTDACGRYIATVLVGKLDCEDPSIPHVVLCKELPKTNHSTVAMAVRDALRVLWPDAEQEDKLRLFVTDSAAYMLKTGECLKAFHPRMLHVTCLAHGLHRVAEEIREQHSVVNEIISSVKKIFLKAPSRVITFRELCPSIPLPPQPVTTRWGTWLSAAIYYAENYESIVEVVDALDEREATAIVHAKKALNSGQAIQELSYIKANFSHIQCAIKKLEETDLPMIEALQVVQEVRDKVAPGPVGESIAKKLEAVLARSPDFKKMEQVGRVLCGKKLQEALAWNPKEIAAMKFAPLTSCDVERSFSAFKRILTENRRGFTPENLSKYFIVQCHLRSNN